VQFAPTTSGAVDEWVSTSADLLQSEASDSAYSSVQIAAAQVLELGNQNGSA
jgi:hypothetical protein